MLFRSGMVLMEWTWRVMEDAATTAVRPGNPACSAGCRSCHSCRTGCSTGSTGSGSGSTAATAERTANTMNEKIISSNATKINK